MLARALVVASLAGLLLPSGAHAATAVVEHGEFHTPDGPIPYAIFKFVAAPGEQNALRLDRDAERLTFTDASGVRAGAGCEQNDATAVVCGGFYPYASVDIDLGDGDDELSVGVASRGEESELTTRARGGLGNDRLDLHASEGTAHGTIAGGDGNDVLIGGPDLDWIRGDDGDDTLNGGDGGDELDGGFGNDEMIGGPGDDRVTYGDRTDPIHIDLADGLPDGGVGEADTLSGFELVAGGRGSDILLGTDGPDDLVGGWALQPGEYVGGDVINGRGGDDEISGSSKVDDLRGGAGDDRLNGDSAADVLRGGTGDDHLNANYGGDRLYGGSGDDQLVPGKPGRTRDRLSCGPGADFAGASDERLRPVIKPACETFYVGVSVTKWSFSDGPLTLNAREYGFVCRVTFRAAGQKATRILRPRGHRPIRFRVERPRVLVRANGPCGEGRFPIRAKFLLSE